MGRGRTQTTELFNVVLGRGRGQGHALDALSPSQAAHQEINLLLALVSSGDYDEALETLWRYRTQPQAPLLMKLRDHVSVCLADATYSLWTPAGADFINAVAGDGHADCVILDRDPGGDMHLWPAGSEHVAFEVAAESTLTVCGLVIGEHNFERLPRGWWRDRARTMNTRCAVCESDASSFPETTESIDRMIFPAQTNMELIFRQVLLECVNKNVLDLTGRGHSRGFEKASGAAVASFRRTLQSQALTRLQAGSQPLLSRVLAGQTSEYTTTKALAQLSQKQWNELTEPLLPRRWQAVNTRPTSYLQDQMTRRRTFVRGLRRALETAL